MTDQPTPDEKFTGNPDYLAKLKEGGDAWNAWLQRDNPITPELRGADLSRCRLAGADLQHADLTGAVLSRVHLEGAYLEWANLEGAHLEGAHLQGTHLTFAHLERADLERADLGWARLERANLEEADLGGADLTGADLRGATLAGAKTDRTDLSEAKWLPEAGGLPDPALYNGLDVRGLRYSDPLFDQFVRQSEFIRRCRETCPAWRRPLLFLWWLTCDYGRSIWRWLAASALVIALFGLLFANGHHVQVARDAPMTCLTPLYFSAVTFSTLGFGDVTPCSLAGEAFVMIEVFLGYLALGGAISIFATKFIPPR